jgi:hypothetical protein
VSSTDDGSAHEWVRWGQYSSGQVWECGRCRATLVSRFSPDPRSRVDVGDGVLLGCSDVVLLGVVSEVQES